MAKYSHLYLIYVDIKIKPPEAELRQRLELVPERQQHLGDQRVRVGEVTDDRAVVDVETGRKPTERELADSLVEHRLDSAREDVLSPVSGPHRDEGSDAQLAAGDQYAGRGNAARNQTGASNGRQSSIGWASRSEIAYTTAGLKPSP